VISNVLLQCLMNKLPLRFSFRKSKGHFQKFQIENDVCAHVDDVNGDGSERQERGFEVNREMARGELRRTGEESRRARCRWRSF
jgi:hypothetical protein